MASAIVMLFTGFCLFQNHDLEENKLFTNSRNEVSTVKKINQRLSGGELLGAAPQPRPLHMCVHAESPHSCLTLSDPMDCSLPGSS